MCLRRVFDHGDAELGSDGEDRFHIRKYPEQVHSDDCTRSGGDCCGYERRIDHAVRPYIHWHRFGANLRGSKPSGGESEGGNTDFVAWPDPKSS